jgi:RNA polymerase sigma-70 factor (family 1)
MHLYSENKHGIVIKMSDEELLQLFLNGNDFAYKAIYDRYWLLLYKHARHMLKNDEDAKDVIQEVFTDLWERRNEQLTNYTLPAFLYTATRNKILNIIKHLKVEAKYAHELQYKSLLATESADDLAITNELTAIIEAGIQSLPPKMREVFLLSRNANKSYKEISAELSISDKTVKKQVNNALHVLRGKLSSFLLFF